MMTDLEKDRQNKATYIDSAFETPFIQKILDAMDETERSRLSPEKTEQMLRKISFAATLNTAAVRNRERFKNKPIIFEKQELCVKGPDKETN